MIGISFYFGYNLPPELRAKMIKESGFDTIITTADKRLNKQNGTIKEQIKLFKKYNLKPSSLHMTYDAKDLPYFWTRGIKGTIMTKRLKKDVKLAHKYGFNSVVVHLFGEYSKIGERRILNVLKLCEKLDIPLAIENINCQKLFYDVFENINHKYLKVCYDSGHNNIFDKDFDYLTKYGDKLVALHLHDNMGVNDDNTLNIFGTINWDEIAKKLAKLPPINLDYELLMRYKGGYSAEQTLKACAKQGKELEALINKYRKQYQNKTAKNKSLKTKNN